MSTLIGTVGFFDSATGRGIIHPDIAFQPTAGLSLVVTPEGLRQSGVGSLTSGDRVTCVASPAQGGSQAIEIKQYDGQGIV